MRDARERQGGDLSLIAAQLRINPKYIEAIEADNVAILPGGFIARSFYRQYAAYLGVNDSEIEGEIDRLFSRQDAPLLPGQGPRKEGADLPPLPSYATGRRPSRKLVSAVAGLVAVVAGCAAVYHFWLNAESDLASPPSPVAIQPAQSDAPLFETASGKDPDGPLSLELEADEDVWVQITVAGETVFTGTIQQSETKQLTGVEEARLLVGNAGGLRVYLNGKSVGPIGERGEIRVVRLTPDGARVMSPRQADPKPAAGAAPSTES